MMDYDDDNDKRSIVNECDDDSWDAIAECFESLVLEICSLEGCLLTIK